MKAIYKPVGIATVLEVYSEIIYVEDEDGIRHEVFLSDPDLTIDPTDDEVAYWREIANNRQSQ